MKRSDLMGSVAAVAVCLMFVAGPCLGQTEKGPVAEVLKFAPSNLLGVAHIDVASTNGELKKYLDMMFKYQSDEEGKKFVKVVEEVYPRISSVDVYLFQFGRTPMAIVAIHGKVTPQDFAKGAEIIVGRKFNAREMGNGVSMMPPLQMLDASKNDQIDSNAMFVTLMGVPMQQLLGKISSTEKDKAATMMSKADENAQLWGVGLGLNRLTPHMPVELCFNLPLTASGTIYCDALMGEEAAAKEFEEQIAKTKEDGNDPFAALWKDMTFSREGNRVTFKVPSNGDTVLSMVIGAIKKSQAMARQVNSISILRGIGTAVAMYRVANDDASPRSFQDLIAQGTISARMLIHPNRKGDKDKAVGEGIEDYVLICLPTDAPKELVLAYEKPEMSLFNQVCVTWNDGSVSKVSPEEFDKKLAETKKWLEENKLQK